MKDTSGPAIGQHHVAVLEEVSDTLRADAECSSIAAVVTDVDAHAVFSCQGQIDHGKEVSRSPPFDSCEYSLVWVLFIMLAAVFIPILQIFGIVPNLMRDAFGEMSAAPMMTVGAGTPIAASARAQAIIIRTARNLLVARLQRL